MIYSDLEIYYTNGKSEYSFFWIVSKSNEYNLKKFFLEKVKNSL